VLPDEELLWTIQQQGKQALADAGFAQYEVSAYAKDRRQCRHNLNYWLFGDYLGIGAGAHSKLSFPAHNKITRVSKHKHPRAYMQSATSAARIQEQFDVSETDSRFEFLMNALRLNNGFTASEFLQRTGEPVSVVMDKLALAEQRGLIKRTIGEITPTELGLRYLDSLLDLFLEPSNSDTRKSIPITPAGN
jgi:oxygen-independent coproporphyrinogen-3 oxidase